MEIMSRRAKVTMYNEKFDYWYEDAGLVGPLGFFAILAVGMALMSFI